MPQHTTSGAPERSTRLAAVATALAALALVAQAARQAVWGGVSWLDVALPALIVAIAWLPRWIARRGRQRARPAVVWAVQGVLLAAALALVLARVATLRGR